MYGAGKNDCRHEASEKTRLHVDATLFSEVLAAAMAWRQLY